MGSRRTGLMITPPLFLSFCFVRDQRAGPRFDGFFETCMFFLGLGPCTPLGFGRDSDGVFHLFILHLWCMHLGGGRGWGELVGFMWDG